MSPPRSRLPRWSTSALLSNATQRQMDRLAQQIEDSRRTRPAGTRSRAMVAFVAAVAALMAVAVVALLSSGGALKPPAPEVEPQVLCLFTNREAPALAVINTVFHAAKTPGAIVFHVVVSEVSCCQGIIALSGRLALTGNKLLVHTLGELTRVLLNDGFAPPWTLPALPDGDDDWLVKPAGWDLDGKHNSPLNHLRFYIPHFPFLAGVERVLFVDDDIIVNRDVAEALHHEVQPGMAMVTSCAISSYLKECDAFELRADAFTYAQTPFFGFKAYNLNGLTRDDIFCSDTLREECIEQEGLELIQREAVRINGEEVAFETLKAWNYGYTLMHNRHWLELSLTRRYEQWIESNTRHKIVPTYSLGYGLGLAFLAMAGTVQCYDPAVVRVMEGMAFLDKFDLLANNITEHDVDRSTYIHFTGDRKPWTGKAFDEWKGRYEHVNVQFDFLASKKRRRKQLFVMLSGQHEASEWALTALDGASEVCASGESADNSRGYPIDAFMPQSIILGNEWQHACSRKSVCAWRHFSTLVEGTNAQPYRYGFIAEPWRTWWNGEAAHNATLLFETYLRAILGDPEHLDAHPDMVLPCRCKDTTTVIGFKWLLSWSSTNGKHAQWAQDYYDGEEIPVLNSAFEIHIPAMRVFKSLGAKFIWWKRSDVGAAYASMVGNCKPGQNCSAAAAVNTKAREAEYFARRTEEERTWLQRHLEALEVTPLVVTFEECARNRPVCATKLQEHLGLEHPDPELLPPLP